MTQAPTPGPLTSESVKLLVKGDWLCDGVCDPWQFSHIENGVVYGLDGYTAMIEPLLLRNAFIGRPDADGWIFNEQGWAENPVPGQRVDVRFRDGTVDENGPSDDWDWPWDADQRQHDIIAFRLAPTAPVEASGSERALEDAVDFGVGFLVDGQRVSPERVTVCHGDSSPLRPQLSGECEACKRGEVRHFSTDDGFWVEITTSAGGANEHGLNGWIETLEHYLDGSTKRREYVATDSPATTPARDEAQDEGAAGERDKRAWIDRWNAIEGAAQDALHTMTELLEAPNLKRMQYALGERRDALASALNLPEAGTAWMRPAHPSPTPAADADRVRIAVQNGVARSMASDDQWKELSPPARAVLMLNVCRHVTEALAALKSEGK